MNFTRLIRKKLVRNDAYNLLCLHLNNYKRVNNCIFAAVIKLVSMRLYKPEEMPIITLSKSGTLIGN